MMQPLHLFALALPLAVAFHIPHAHHHHPIYVQYYKEKLDKEASRHQTAPSSDSMEARGTASALMEREYSYERESFLSNDYLYVGDSDVARWSLQKSLPSSKLLKQHEFIPIDASISTPISYDQETGMVQTAVRAIVKHPIASFVDHHVVALSSTLVISLGAVHELVDCIELEWAHHATSSTEGLAILSLGHALHYGRETIRQLMELEANKHEKEGQPSPDQV